MEVPVREEVTGVTRTKEVCGNLHINGRLLGVTYARNDKALSQQIVIRRVLVGIWIRKGKKQTFGREGSLSTASYLKESASLWAGLVWFIWGVGFQESLPRFFRNSSYGKMLLLSLGVEVCELITR